MFSKNLILAVGAAALLAACGSDEPEAKAPQNEATPTNNVAAAPETLAEAEAILPETPPTGAETVRSAEAHVHGDAKLALVLDGATLTAELESPLYNLVGFEHAAETDEQRAAINSAEAALNDPAALFAINSAANCVAYTRTLDVHLEADDHADEHAHDAAGHDDHTHDEHNHEDENHSDHADANHDDHGHKDMLISYTFTCADTAKVSPITVNLFDKFPNMQELEVVYLGPDTQDLFTLTPTNTTINLRP